MKGSTIVILIIIIVILFFVFRGDGNDTTPEPTVDPDAPAENADASNGDDTDMPADGEEMMDDKENSEEGSSDGHSEDDGHDHSNEE